MDFCSYFGCDPHFFELNNKYEEILKLDKMLTETSIPHILRRCMDGWQVCYPDAYISNRGCIMDAIEHFGSYGVENDKLEIMGLLTPNEENFDSVLGYLTAENVFERIKAHYEGKWHEYVYKVDGKHKEPMTPEEAAEEMRKICSKHEDDEEVCHMAMDDLMCKILYQLGYGEVVDIFDNTSKWYA